VTSVRGSVALVLLVKFVPRANLISMCHLSVNVTRTLIIVSATVSHIKTSTSVTNNGIRNFCLTSTIVHLNTNDQFIKFTEATHTHLPTPERQEIRMMMATVKGTPPLSDGNVICEF